MRGVSLSSTHPRTTTEVLSSATINFFAPPHEILWAVFRRTIKRLVAPFRMCMTGCKFLRDQWAAIFRVQSVSGNLATLNKGGAAVELTLKWDVLAVCTVFVFVGAILLGAF